MPTASYYHAVVDEAQPLILRHRQATPLSRQSAWLALNPALARALGWQPAPAGQFGWQDAAGTLLVESVYWVNGNVAMFPPASDSEVGEGWLVVASAAALRQLRAACGPLYAERWLTRTQLVYGEPAEEQTAGSHYGLPSVAPEAGSGETATDEANFLTSP